MVMGRECLVLTPLSSRTSGGDSNSSEWALWEPSGLGWTGPGLASALWMRMCRGMAGGWLGGSVVGLGGSICTVGTITAGGLLGGFKAWTLGGDGGMWEGGKAVGSKLDRGTPAFAFSSLPSSLRTVDGAVPGAEVGSVGDSGA